MAKAYGRAAAAMAAVVSLIGGVMASGGAAEAAPAVSQSATVRLLAAEGLNVGFSITAFRLQYNDLDSIYVEKPGKCEPFSGSRGSQKLTKEDVIGSTVVKADLVYYYDNACATPYMNQTLDYTQKSAGDITLSAKTVYTEKTGHALGTMATTGTWVITDSGSRARYDAVSRFTVPGIASPVTVGLECLESPSGQNVTASCQSGVAQTVTKLKESLGSVTSFTITAAKNLAGKSTFKGTTATRRVGKANALSVTSPSGKSLSLKGAGSSAGPVATSGKEAASTLFAAPPTSWTITDQARKLAVTISVASGSTDALRGAVKDTATGASLATLSLDETGTGTISYAKSVRAGTTSAAVTSWVLAG